MRCDWVAISLPQPNVRKLLFCQHGERSLVVMAGQ